MVNMTKEKDSHVVEKIPGLLNAHKSALLEELGPAAYDLLTPAQVKEMLGLKPHKTNQIPDLVRQGWLEGSGQKVGNIHLYYRWRVEFAKRYRKPYGSRKGGKKEGPS